MTGVGLCWAFLMISHKMDFYNNWHYLVVANNLITHGEYWLPTKSDSKHLRKHDMMRAKLAREIAKSL